MPYCFSKTFQTPKRYSTVLSLNSRTQITSAFKLPNATHERGVVISCLALTQDSFHLRHVAYLSHSTNLCGNFISNLQGLLSLNSLSRTMVTGTVRIYIFLQDYWLKS